MRENWLNIKLLTQKCSWPWDSLEITRWYKIHVAPMVP